MCEIGARPELLEDRDRFGGRSLHFMPWAAMDAVDLVSGARVVPTTGNPRAWKRT